jgi:hypothetical protein
MTAVVIASWQVFIHALNLFHHHATGGRGHHLLENGPSVGPWRVSVIVISLSIMVLVLVSAEAFLHLLGTRLTPTPPPVMAVDSSNLRWPQMAVEALNYSNPGVATPTNGDETDRADYSARTGGLVGESVIGELANIQGKRHRSTEREA